MRPFFPYYGSKYRLARLLGPPQCDTIIEPFAGSACYSLFWWEYWWGPKKQVILVDIDPVIIGVFEWLKSPSAARDIGRLPDRVLHIDELDDLKPKVCEAAKWFVGLWLDHAQSRPAVTMCNWGRNSVKWRNYWSADIKYRILKQIPLIRNNPTIICGNYWDAPDIEAHWHIDAPYQGSCGRAYRLNHIDYHALGQFVDSLKGYIQVCGGPDDDWLPFEFFAEMPSHRHARRSFEYLYQKDNHRKR